MPVAAKINGLIGRGTMRNDLPNVEDDAEHTRRKWRQHEKALECIIMLDDIGMAKLR